MHSAKSNQHLLSITVAHCAVNEEAEAKEPFCDIIDNSCLEDALVGSLWAPQAKRELEGERQRDHAVIRQIV